MKQYSAKTIDEVLNKICQLQDCRPEEITYEVISNEKGGLFGLNKSVTVEAYTSKDVKEFIFDYLGNYFTEIDQAVSIEIIVNKDKENPNELVYKVILDSEENNNLLIGKNGSNLTAITTLLRAATNNTFKKRINIEVDINHYKEDKYRKLKRFARGEAIKVVRSKTDVKLDYLPADERKIIHQYLQNFKGVTTVSEGDGNQRHLIIKYDSTTDTHTHKREEENSEEE